MPPPSRRTTTPASAPTTTSSTPGLRDHQAPHLRRVAAARPRQTTGLPSAKVLGGPRGRAKAFRPDSLINISAMSFGSMSGNAIKALNARRRAGRLHAQHRRGRALAAPPPGRRHRAADRYGVLRLPRRATATSRSDKLKEVVDSAPVKAIEIKLSQGAKPGLGGLLPAAKVTKEISEIRGIPMGRDCASPARHTAFSDEDSLLDFVELLAAETGLPVGIKSSVGDMQLLARAHPADGPGRPRRRLRHHRRRRGRHRRLAADLRRLDRAAVPDGLLPGLRHLRRGRPDRRRDLHRVRQAGRCRRTPWSRSRWAPTWSTSPGRR